MTDNPYEGVWTYVGPRGPKDIKHKVVYIDRDENLIFTWSHPLRMPVAGMAGCAWMGEWHQFLLEFKR